MSFDSKRAKEITATPSNEVPACCVADCQNGADPRYSILVNGVFAAACDGHESYSADHHRLRDPLPRWPIHESIREREALALLPSVLDEIDRLHQLLRDEFAIGAEYQKQAAIAQAEVERLRITDMQAAANFDQALHYATEEVRSQLDAVTKARDQACRIAKDWIGMRAHSLDEPARLAIKEVAELSKAGQ